MTEEIKEILDLLKRCDNTYLKIENSNGEKEYEYHQVNDLRLDGYHSQLLLDYITNLQQENEKLKEQLQNKGIIKTCENCEWFGTCPHSYREYDYKQRNEKVIEYINFVINHYKEQLETPIEDTYFDTDVNRKGYILSIIAYLQTILDTLNGSDEK